MVQQEYTHCLKSRIIFDQELICTIPDGNVHGLTHCTLVDSSNLNVERVHFSFTDFQVRMGETINVDFNSV